MTSRLFIASLSGAICVFVLHWSSPTAVGDDGSATVALPLILAESDWSSGDRGLRNLNPGAPHEGPVVFSIWPDHAQPSGDPDRDLKERLIERPDGLLRITDVAMPTIHLFRPKQPDGRACLVFPGGAYNALAAQHEGTEVAQWLCDQGITAFVIKYRVPRRAGLSKHAVALQDAQRAIRWVRSQAPKLEIDPNRIGVAGFSAGGNLAALTIHLAQTDSYDRVDTMDDHSARPNFAILIYPAYLTEDPGDSKLATAFESIPNGGKHPPIFLAAAADDRHAGGSLVYMMRLRQRKAPAELHVYRSGGHGTGLQERGYPFSTWSSACQRWLNDLKAAGKE